MIRIPLNLLPENVLEEANKKIRVAYLINRNTILLIYEDNNFKEVPAKIEIESVEKYLNELHQLAKILFDREKCNSNFNYSSLKSDKTPQENSDLIISSYLSELRSCIDHIATYISAKIYKKLRKYVNENVVEEYIMNRGLHNLLPVLINGDSIAYAYRMLKEFEENELIRKYNRSNK